MSDVQSADVKNLSLRLGQRIRTLRQSSATRLTQEELASRAGISVSFLSMIERGERAPHIETLCRVAEALGITIGELFWFADEKAPTGEDLVRPLAEFVRTHRLTPRDVERLLGVARAMFAN